MFDETRCMRFALSCRGLDSRSRVHELSMCLPINSLRLTQNQAFMQEMAAAMGYPHGCVDCPSITSLATALPPNDIIWETVRFTT